MNKCVFIWPSIALCLGLVSSAMAQETLVHQVKFPEGDAVWTVIYDKEDTVNPAPDVTPPPPAVAADKAIKKIVKIDIVRRDNLRRDITTLSDGSTVQRWWIVSPPLALFDNGGRVSSMRGSAMAQLEFDASSFDWIAAKTFGGMKSYQGKSGQYYEMTILDPDGGPTRILRAWIDPTSHLPVAYDNGFETVSFLFPKGAPIPTLHMPANFQQKYDQIQAFYAPPRQPGK